MQVNHSYSTKRRSSYNARTDKDIKLHQSIYHQKNEYAILSKTKLKFNKENCNQTTCQTLASPIRDSQKQVFEFILILETKEILGTINTVEEFQKLYTGIKTLIAKKETIEAMVKNGEVTKKIKIFKF